ncbi:MAG: zinc-binding dehydrogenase, partial [Solirubrobacteraceae bacterium]
FGQSSFATHAIVPERTAVKVDKDLPLEQLGPLGCGVITGAGSVIEALKVGFGDSIAIFGTGGVGLSAVMAARLVGASRIVAVDINPARLELARELGAEQQLLRSSWDPDPRSAVQRMCGELDREALQTVARFTSFLVTTEGAQRRRIGFLESTK